MKKRKMALSLLLIMVLLTVLGSGSVYARISGYKGVDAAGKSDLVVVLDAGHGGYDSGAVGNRLYEKDLTLKIAKYCQAELSTYKGVKVYMTRSKDTFISLDNRVAYAAKVKADVFVSLHINSAVASANGAEVFYPNSNYRPAIGAQGQKLARMIQSNLTALGLRNRGIKTLDLPRGTYADGSAADYYAVIRGSKKVNIPGIIVEHAFISNASDAKTYLSSNSALKKLGVADAKGIAACYGLKKDEGSSAALKKTNLTKLVGNSSASVTLEWQKVKGASGYEIYRGASKKGTYARIASVKKAGTVSYKDKSVKSGKTYYYKVRPYKTAGGRKETAGFCVPQKVKLLKKPNASVKGKDASNTKVKWSKVTGAVRYEIYRSESKNGKFKKIASIQDATAFQDIAKKSGTTYYYKVRAVGNGIKGNTYSSYSAVQ